MPEIGGAECGGGYRDGDVGPGGAGRSPGAPQELSCSGQRCLGSLVLPRPLPAPTPEGTRPPEELLEMARDFITQYYVSLRR